MCRRDDGGQEASVTMGTPTSPPAPALPKAAPQLALACACSKKGGVLVGGEGLAAPVGRGGSCSRLEDSSGVMAASRCIPMGVIGLTPRVSGENMSGRWRG